MRILAKIWLLVMLLTLVIGGCRRAPGEAERRLMAIDSLIAAHPDSALALLAAIDTATLAEPDRAYHALLQTQAMYKAGVPVDDSTLICRAQRYYADHGPVDRQIRAMRYRASVAEDLGDPEQAMRWYKSTELAAREHGDDFNTGYALMSMGLLYKTNFEDTLARMRYRQSLDFIPDSCIDIQMYCFYELSQLYQMDGASGDSALFFIQALRRMAQDNGDTTMMAWSLLSETSKQFYDSCYSASKNLAVEAIHTYSDVIPYTCWTYAIQSFARLRMVDSAEHYLNMAPPPVSAVDSAGYFHSLSMISSLKNEWKDAHRYEVLSDSLTESMRFNSGTTSLRPAENAASASFRNEKGKFQWLSSWPFLTAMAIASLILVAAAVIITLRRSKERKESMEHARWLESNHIQQLKHLQREMSDLALDSQTRLDKLSSETQRLQDIAKKAELRAEQYEAELNDRQREIGRLMEDQQEARRQADQAKASLDENLRNVDMLRRKQMDTEFIQTLYAQLSAAFEDVIQSFGGMARDFTIFGKNADIFIKKFQKRMQSFVENQELWTRIETHINQSRKNALKNFCAAYPGLNEKERRLVMLTILGFDSNAIAVCLGYNGPKVVSAVRSRLKKRLSIESDLEAYVAQMSDDADVTPDDKH